MREYAPEAVAERCGIAAETIRRIAAELATAAFEQAVDARHALDRLRRAGATPR